MSWANFQAQRLQMLSKQPKAILPAMEFQNSLFLITDLSTSQMNSNYLQENGTSNISQLIHTIVKQMVKSNQLSRKPKRSLES